MPIALALLALLNYSSHNKRAKGKKMQIEHDIPIETSAKGRGASGIYRTLHAMEVGDSILVDGKTTSSKDCPAYNSATQYGLRHGKKFTGRQAEPGKVRIWRTE